MCQGKERMARGRLSEDRRQMTGGRGRLSEDGGQMAEGRGRRAKGALRPGEIVSELHPSTIFRTYGAGRASLRLKAKEKSDVRLPAPPE